jgi:hypothetical protein
MLLADRTSSISRIRSLAWRDQSRNAEKLTGSAGSAKIPLSLQQATASNSSNSASTRSEQSLGRISVKPVANRLRRLNLIHLIDHDQNARGFRPSKPHQSRIVIPPVTGTLHGSQIVLSDPPLSLTGSKWERMVHNWSLEDAVEVLQKNESLMAGVG